MGVTKRLILCAGPFKYPGYTTLDCNPDYRPDICAVLPPLPREYRNEQWDEIYLVHGIEHFHFWEAHELLTQIHQALKPGGFVVLEQPNLEVAAKVMLGLMPPMTANPERSGIYSIYGNPANNNPLMHHKWGWTPETLTEAVVDAGFSPDNVKVGEAKSRPFAQGRDFRLEATK